MGFAQKHVLAALFAVSLICFSIVSAQQLSIVVSPDGTDAPGCGQNETTPCQSIQYAIDQGVNSTSNEVDLFLTAGTFLLHKTVKIPSISFSITGQATVLQCAKAANSDITVGPALKWTFNQSAELKRGSLRNLTVTGCTSSAADGRGGAVHVAPSQQPDPHNLFFNTNFSVHSVNFERNIARDEGGAISCSFVDVVELYSCTFESNAVEFLPLSDPGIVAARGGAVSIGQVSQVALMNCQFSANSLSISNTSFPYHPTAIHGGALSVANSDHVTIEDCQFKNNSITVNLDQHFDEVFGGAMYLAGTSIDVQQGSFSVSNTEIFDSVINTMSSTTYLGGGAAYIYNFNTTNIDHLSVSNASISGRDQGSGVVGGAVALVDCVSSSADFLQISHAAISATDQTVLGGCMFVSARGVHGTNATSLTIRSQSSFDNCSAKANTVSQNAGVAGGGLYVGDVATVEYSHSTVSTSTIVGEASCKGSFIFTDSTVRMCNASGVTESVTAGGGISLSAVYVALISNSNMEFCNAGVGFGGGVFIEESGASLFSTSIMHCVAEAGGGLFSTNSALHLDSNTVSRCHARTGGGLMVSMSTELVTSSKDVYRNNTAEEGGGVFLNCTAHGQSVCNATFRGLNMLCNQATFGGCFFLSDPSLAISPMVTNHSVLTNNSAYGGFAVSYPGNANFVPAGPSYFMSEDTQIDGNANDYGTQSGVATPPSALSLASPTTVYLSNDPLDVTATLMDRLLTTVQGPVATSFTGAMATSCSSSPTTPIFGPFSTEGTVTFADISLFVLNGTLCPFSVDATYNGITVADAETTITVANCPSGYYISHDHSTGTDTCDRLQSNHHSVYRIVGLSILGVGIVLVCVGIGAAVAYSAWRLRKKRRRMRLARFEDENALLGDDRRLSVQSTGGQIAYEFESEEEEVIDDGWQDEHDPDKMPF